MDNWQDSHYLTNLTHLDGRNAAKLLSLRSHFSELAWMKERLYVIVSHLVAIIGIVGKPLSKKDSKKLLDIVDNFSLKDGERVVRFEKTVNHDLKALELFVASRLPKNLLSYKRYILFGLGSEDINSIAFARILKRSRGEVMLPALTSLLDRISLLARHESDSVMIARTHGLPAGVTTFGKELANPLLRLCDEISITKSLLFQAKLTGEVGSFHGLAGSGIKADWLTIADRFLASMGVESNHGSTQIIPYDACIRYLHSLFRINSILIDLSRNMWLYVLLGYVRVIKKDKEVGSSGMPHKVNPIYFEGAEGGLVMANGIIETLARALMVNRLQRDFTDSTMRRNTVLVFAYSLLSYQSLIEAFERLEVNRPMMTEDLSRHGEVWIETIKVVMLHAGCSDAFDVLKHKTRGNSYTVEELEALVVTLPVDKVTLRHIHRIIHQKVYNPYPTRIVREAVSKVNKL